MDGPRGAVPGLPDRDGKSGWQLAQHAWEDSGVAWEAPPAPETLAPVTPAPETPAPETLAEPYGRPAPDASEWCGTDWDPTDPWPTRPDLPVLPEPAGRGLPDRADPWPTRHDLPVLGQEPAEAGPGFRWEEPASPAPPLPKRIRRASEGWNSSPFAPASPFAPTPPFTPSPAFASPRPDRPTRFDAPRGFTSPPLSAPVAPVPPPGVRPLGTPPLGEPDELFRAWQGSVERAAGRRRTLRVSRRPAGGRGPGLRGRGWQVAKIGVPAAVIVTVGAGALMMLTGRANDMLAERASSGALSSGKPTSGPGASGQTSAGPASAAGGTGLTLAGYPAEHGTVGVAALWSAGGATVAVGYADGHPAVWRHAADGTWSLVSAPLLGGVTGNLTSVAQGPSGWIAVGSVNENGTAEPAVFCSTDGVNWRQLTTLPALAGPDAQFLGVAAGPGGYLVVGKQGTGSAATVGLWWSNDMQNWVNGGANGPAGSFADAAAATTDGFVAVGSENNGHTFWTSTDGQHWTAHDLAKPSGATTVTLTSVAAGQGGQSDRFVAAGVATTSAGDIPIVVTAANDGTHIGQTVLSSPGGPAAVTAVTATADGFVAAGEAGPASARQAVTWTSKEGRIWTPAAAFKAAGASEVTALAATAGPALTATAQRGADPAVLTVPAP